MNSLSQRSPYIQIGMGAFGGLLTGYVLLKASKLMALAAGGTILALELAVEAGLIEFESDSIEFRSNQSGNQLRIAGQTHRLEDLNLGIFEQIGENSRKACASSRRLCVAFLGGFLLGFGLA